MNLSPQNVVRLAIASSVAILVAWPASLFLTSEPPLILSLSWLALLLTCIDWIQTSRVHRDQGS